MKKAFAWIAALSWPLQVMIGIIFAVILWKIVAFVKRLFGNGAYTTPPLPDGFNPSALANELWLAHTGGAEIPWTDTDWPFFGNNLDKNKAWTKLADLKDDKHVIAVYNQYNLKDPDYSLTARIEFEGHEWELIGESPKQRALKRLGDLGLN